MTVSATPEARSPAGHQIAGDPLTVFVVHPSHMLTDHLPHGDGLIAYNFLRELAKRGHRLRIAVEHMSLLAPIPGDVTLYPMERRPRIPGAQRFAYMAHVRRTLRAVQARERVDVAHQLNPVTVGLSLGMLGSEVPLVLGPFEPTWPKNAGGTRLQRITGRMYDAARWPLGRLTLAMQQAPAAALLVSSPAARVRIVRVSRQGARLQEFPFGIDAEAFTPSPSHTPPARPTLLFLANLERHKGIFTLLDAFDAVAERVPAARLVIAGDGAAKGEVLARVEALRARESVELVGRVPRARVAEVMRSASVYCLPSFGEPFGMTVLEAMACGLPVVVGASGGVAHLAPPEGRRLFTPGDVHGLADALAEVLADPALQHRMGATNRREIETRFAWSALGARLEQLYHEVIRGRKSPHP